MGLVSRRWWCWGLMPTQCRRSRDSLLPCIGHRRGDRRSRMRDEKVPFIWKTGIPTAILVRVIMGLFSFRDTDSHLNQLPPTPTTKTNKTSPRIQNSQSTIMIMAIHHALHSLIRHHNHDRPPLIPTTHYLKVACTHLNAVCSSFSFVSKRYRSTLEYYQLINNGRQQTAQEGKEGHW